MARPLLAAAFVLALGASAAAQDFGTQWTDRITHILLDDDAPLDPRPLSLTFSAGEVYAYDSNIFLSNTGATKDSIFTTFGQALMRYAEKSWDAEVDLLLNYNAYSDNSDSSTDEERVFGRIRYQGPYIRMQLSEVFRRESSPTDAVFTDRVRRIVSDLVPELVMRLNDNLWFEATSTVEFVAFQNENFQTSDNVNSRSMGTMAWTTKRVGMDVLVQGGYLTIHYQDFDAPPDAYGWIGRIGVRGDPAPDLHLFAAAGATHVASTNSSQIGRASPMTTMDAEFHLGYTISELFTIYADFSRRPGFAGGTAAYQIVNAASAILEYTPREDLKIRARIQHDRTHNSDGDTRSWLSGTVGPEYRLLENLQFDLHATYRMGRTPESPGDNKFSDLILSAGIIGTF